MRHLAAWYALSLAAGPVLAQHQPSRSNEYLLVTGPADVRALWVNPAGIAVVSQASLMGELAFSREVTDWRVNQYTFGLSSRAAALGYQRDRYATGESIGTWRVGGAVNLGRGSLGTSIAFYQSGRGFDAGLRYAPAPGIHLGAVVRNIGRPAVRDSILRITGITGLAFIPSRSFRLAAEAVAVERRPVAGYDVSYRTGLQLSLTGRLRMTALTAVHFDRDLQVERWTAGIALGGFNQIIGIGGGVPNSISGRQLESMSISAVSTRITAVEPR